MDYDEERLNAKNSSETTNFTFQVYGYKINRTKQISNIELDAEMAPWMKYLWFTLFVLMLIVAVGGNSIVMWIVLAHRRMRTVTNYFLVNLSLADLMMSIFNCTFNFTYMLNSNWKFGESYCKVNNYVGIMSVAASVFTLTGISVDRYLAIVWPLKPRTSKKSAQIVIVIIWAASLLLGLPSFIYSTIKVYSWRNETISHCIMSWPDGLPMESTLDYLYNVIIFVVTYLVPMSAMVACYTAMGRALWGSKAIGELTQRQQDSITSKKKVVKMFIIVVVIFAVCWFPYHSYFIYIHHHKQTIMYTWYIKHLYLAFYFLAMSNAMVNPIIYYWMNTRFRQYFNTVICEWRCFQRKFYRSDGAESPPTFRLQYNHSNSRSRSDIADDLSEQADRPKQTVKMKSNFVQIKKQSTDREGGRHFDQSAKGASQVASRDKRPLSNEKYHSFRSKENSVKFCLVMVDVPKSYYQHHHKLDSSSCLSSSRRSTSTQL